MYVSGPWLSWLEDHGVGVRLKRSVTGSPGVSGSGLLTSIATSVEVLRASSIRRLAGLAARFGS
jgi:hypothetical protein